MRHNQDPQLGHGSTDPSDLRLRSRGHQRSRVATRLTAVVAAAAAATTFVAACGSGSGSSNAGGASRTATAPKTPGTTGPSPDASPTATATPRPTEQASSDWFTTACAKLSPVVLAKVGTYLGYSGLASAEENCSPSRNYQGNGPHAEGPAVNWGGAGTVGSPVASFLLQEITNDKSGNAFNSMKNLGARSTTIDGLPAIESDMSGTVFAMVRQGSNDWYAELNVADAGGQLGPSAEQLTGALIADISGS
jgi:hypothetical protein